MKQVASTATCVVLYSRRLNSSNLLMLLREHNFKTMCQLYPEDLAIQYRFAISDYYISSTTLYLLLSIFKMATLKADNYLRT
jgi:hypothetical protein